MSTGGSKALGSLVCLGTSLLLPGLGLANEEQRIRGLIDDVRGVASSIVIDGFAEDWEGIPRFRDPTGDHVGLGDLRAAAIAPMEAVLLMMVESQPSPSSGELIFVVDYSEEESFDLACQFFFDPAMLDGFCAWFTVPSGEAPQFLGSTPVEFAAGAIVELAIWLDDLVGILPPSMAIALVGPTARSWLRVQALVISADGSSSDSGPAVGSYRLTETAVPLDPPLPASAAVKVLSFPLEDRWWVAQGAFGTFSHANEWAYDFVIVDDSVSPFDPGLLGPSGPTNEATYAFGSPILAPAPGQVVEVVHTEPDIPPFVPTPVQPLPHPQDFGPANTISVASVDQDGPFLYRLVHLMQGSAAVLEGGSVEAGQLVGAIGNSGFTTGPHLHLEAGFLTGQTLSIALADVAVGLNPHPDDPWNRQMQLWEIREGFFVPEPGLVSLQGVSLAAILAFRQLGRASGILHAVDPELGA